MKKKILLIVTLVVLAIAGVTAWHLHKPANKTGDLHTALTHEQATEDLTYIKDTLAKYHPAWSKEGNEELVTRFEQAYAKEVAALDEKVTILELWQASSRMIHVMSDAHTRASTDRPEGDVRYRIDGEITAINGEDIEDIYKRFLELWPYEIEGYARTRFERYMYYEDYLMLAGVDVEGGIDVTYIKDGKEYTEHFTGEIYSAPAEEYVYYSIDREKKLGIFTLTSCKNEAKYRDVLKEFFGDVAKNNITDIVLDLRTNNGGYIPVSQDFMKYINVEEYQYCNDFKIRQGDYWREDEEIIKNNVAENAFDGNIYVLTSVKTFSAAMDFAMVIKDNDLGVLVGETCGNMPDSYTYTNKYVLPNSKLKLSVPGAVQSRIDESKKGQPLVPDYAVDAAKALDKVYELIVE